MIKVYFEGSSHAEIAAVFDDEKVYAACLPALEKLAEELQMKVTESVEEDESSSDFEEYLEIHHDIVEAIVDADSIGADNLVTKTLFLQGKGGLYELGISLTAKFVEEYKDTVWGEELEYLDIMETFIKKELYGKD